MTYGQVFQACENGSVYSCTPEQLREMLQALTTLTGPNPNPHAKARHCSALIRQRLDEIAADRRVASSQKSAPDHDREHWYKKPVGILVLSVGGGLLLAILKYFFGF
jgi:hypothetical protein